MSNLVKRIITSILLAVVLLFCLFYNKNLWLLLLLLVSIISFFEFSKLINKIFKNRNISIALINLTTLFYLIFFTFSAYDLAEVNVNIFFVILVCIFSDIGGYVVGKTVGGKKLTKISPNKTVSGSIGSFVFSFIPLFIFSILFYEKINSLFINLIFLSIFISLISQVGDLFISFFKRKAGVKDTGNILPGHGGILDRIDGMIFAIPVTFIFNEMFLKL
tara:strand:+ start:452 stop:1108 length:657 start_codon:yes stop_codon:yes gene_type:complete